MAKQITNKVLVKGTKLSNTIQNLYTVPPSIQSAIINSIRVTNFSDSIASFNIHLVPEGETASDANAVVKFLDLNGASIWTDMSAITIEKGTSIQVKSNIEEALSIYVSGVEIENN